MKTLRYIPKFDGHTPRFWYGPTQGKFVSVYKQKDIDDVDHKNVRAHLQKKHPRNYWVLTTAREAVWDQQQIEIAFKTRKALEAYLVLKYGVKLG